MNNTEESVLAPDASSFSSFEAFYPFYLRKTSQPVSNARSTASWATGSCTKTCGRARSNFDHIDQLEVGQLGFLPKQLCGI
jgi:hypothetical protein